MSSLAAGGHESEGSGGFLLTVNFVFVSTVIAYGLGFLTVVLLSRQLGADHRGVTVIYQSAINLAFVVLSLGLGSAVVYFVSKGDLTGREAVEAGLSMTIAAALVTALVVGLSGLILDNGMVYRGAPYWLAIVAIPALVQFQLFETVLRGLGRFGAMNVLNVSLPASVLIALLGVELVAGLTLERAVYAWSLAFVPPAFLGYAIAGPSVWPKKFMPVSRLRPILKFGAQSQAGNLVQLLNYRLDAYLILILTNTTGVALYSTGVSFSEGLWFIANSASVVLLTNITAGDEEYRSRMTPLVCRSTIFISTLGAIAIGAFAPVIPILLGSDYEGAVVPFLCLLPGTVAIAGGKILATYVFSRGRPMINAWIAVVTLVVTLVADVILIPIFDVTGAAIGATIAYCVSFTLTALAYRRLSGASILAAIVPRPSDIGIALEALRGIRGRFATR